MKRYSIFKTEHKLDTYFIEYRGREHKVCSYPKGDRDEQIENVAPYSFHERIGKMEELWFQDVCIVLVADKLEAKALAKADLEEYKKYGAEAEMLSCYASCGELYSRIPFENEMKPNVVYVPVNCERSMKLLDKLSVHSLVVSENTLSHKQCRKLIRKYKNRMDVICVPEGDPTD